jgi:hypothetical protein
MHNYCIPQGLLAKTPRSPEQHYNDVVCFLIETVADTEFKYEVLQLHLLCSGKFTSY